MIIYTGTRQGTASGNADAARHYIAADLTAGAVVVDGIGHDGGIHGLAPARVAAQRGPLAGLLAAGLLVAAAREGDGGFRDDATAVVCRADEGQV